MGSGREQLRQNGKRAGYMTCSDPTAVRRLRRRKTAEYVGLEGWHITMKMENLRDDKKLKLEFAGLIILVILVASICVFYVKNLERNMKVESDRYLGEVASQVGNVLNDRLDAVFYTMDIMALTCASMDSLDQQLSYLKLVQDKTPEN